MQTILYLDVKAKEEVLVLIKSVCVEGKSEIESVEDFRNQERQERAENKEGKEKDSNVWSSFLEKD